jgi:hypothetical protein
LVGLDDGDELLRRAEKREIGNDRVWRSGGREGDGLRQRVLLLVGQNNSFLKKSRSGGDKRA